MKKVVLLAGLLVIMAGIFIPLPFKKDSSSLISPLLTSSKTLSQNLWTPKEDRPIGNVLAVEAAPDVTAKSAIFVDTKDGRILYSKNAHERLPIASLTKVMTVLVALEYRNLDEKLLVSPEAASMVPDKMFLNAGEKLTLKELLYGIFLVSANDAAEVLAETTTGNKDEFIKMMNKKAADLGMKDTHFVNPTGYDEDSGNTYSTTYDLAILTRQAIRKFPILVDITSTQHIELPATDEHQYYDMYSGISLLSTYPGAVGFKIGYTPEAGYTFITLVRKEGHEVLGVLLDSQNRREEARELLDYSFSQL